uniref:Uncharacterized protein n=1 Tax=Panagrolaimus sp. PS1159 TaxID=55785 RepID=A0AC35FVN5_9BILA
MFKKTDAEQPLVNASSARKNHKKLLFPTLIAVLIIFGIFGLSKNITFHEPQKQNTSIATKTNPKFDTVHSSPKDAPLEKLNPSFTSASPNRF